ncbi:MAG: tetratricopeptide repeat protein [Fimbriimonadaceae bacterium]
MKKRSTLLAVLAALFLAQAALHAFVIFPRWKRDYAPKQAGQSAAGLDPAQFLFALVGFKEFIAGILWVRADSFFEQGNYDAVLPIIRLVTWLDPHQIDVYATGMWHIGYNFTDTEQRSDRRYIPVALAFGAEGARNNPTTYELFFETGWLWYHKIDDNYENAVRWWEEAMKRKDMPPARKNLLSPAYQRNGQIREALDLYYKLYDEAVERAKKDNAFGNLQIRDTIERNIDTMLVRMVQRGWVAQQKGYYDQGDYDTKPPFDVGFSVRATVEEPAVIRFQGTWNVLPVGTRIRVVLKDKDMPNDQPGGMQWDQGTAVNLDVPVGLTFMQEQLFVRNRRFDKRVDMSNDRTMYPFKSDRYLLEFYYNPRSAPPHIQDKFGYNGEGMTDKNFLNTEVRKGQRVVFARLELTRDQILRRGRWMDEVPFVQTSNYVAPNVRQEKSDVIIVPGILAGDKPQQ